MHIGSTGPAALVPAALPARGTAAVTATGRPPGPAVVIASDGSALADAGTPLAAVLGRYATLVRDLTGLPTRPLDLCADGITRLPARFAELCPAGGAVYLAHTEPEPAGRPPKPATGPSAGPPGGPPVLTEQDTTAVAVAAAVLATLSRSRRAPQVSRITIVGADVLPLLCPLLMSVGVGDITTWNERDAAAFPLRCVTRDVDAVVDLLGGRRSRLRGPTPWGGPPVVVVDADRDPLLALPGLVRALVDAPGARPDLDVYDACVYALVMATPPHQRLPRGPNRALTDQVAAAVTRVLQPSLPH